MQIFVLDRCPRRAARRLRSKKLPGKMLVEALQLLGKALRVHKFEPLDNVYDGTTASHPCAVWVAEGRDAFGWTLAHARELHTIFDLHCRRRCKKCNGYKSKPHASLKALERMEQIVRDGLLPKTLPDNVHPDVFYSRLEAIRQRQTPSARKKSGDVVRVASGLPVGIECMAVAVDGEHQKTCLALDADNGVDGVQTYNNYHAAKFPVVDAPWFDPAADTAVETHDCVCACKAK